MSVEQATQTVDNIVSSLFIFAYNFVSIKLMIWIPKQKVGLSMKLICILCDQSYQLSPQQVKKVKKFPQLIQICPECSSRITKKVLNRMKQTKEKKKSFYPSKD